jgi:hypothetical protein
MFGIIQGKLLLLDFNPFGAVTDGLMFTWEELTDSDTSLKGTDNSTQVNNYIKRSRIGIPSSRTWTIAHR